MKVLGIDFTSRPSKRKPITCIECVIDGDVLRTQSYVEWTSYEGFEIALAKSGPWIAGIDFPFGLARRFIENIGWPASWPGYVLHASKLGRHGFRQTLDAYKEKRSMGDKEHRRTTDEAAGSVSPQKLFGVPVGLMFFEGAPRLLASGVGAHAQLFQTRDHGRGRGFLQRAAATVAQVVRAQEQYEVGCAGLGEYIPVEALLAVVGLAVVTYAIAADALVHDARELRAPRSHEASCELVSPSAVRVGGRDIRVRDRVPHRHDAYCGRMGDHFDACREIPALDSFCDQHVRLRAEIPRW